MNPNPYQQVAIDCDSPRTILLAGAGSGKTATLTQRIARLMGDGWHPGEILAVTFTRAAAAEMRERLVAAVGPRGRRVRASTFHSLCAATIREFADLVPISSSFSIYDEQDHDDLIAFAAVELGDRKVAEARASAEAKGEPYRLHPRTRERLLRDERVVGRVAQLLREAQALTYDGLEETMLGLLQRPEVADQLRLQWLHVLVDECQDLSEMQHDILTALAPDNLFLVGDIAQSIYGFRGARVDLFQALVASAAWTVLELPTNYRSLPPIVEVANRCAAAMAVPGLEMEAAREEMLLLPVSTLTAEDRETLHQRIADDAAGKAPWSDLAILAPTWHLLEQLSPVLEASGIPHRIARRALDVWETPEARQVLDCLRVASNPWDHLALRRALGGSVSARAWAEMRAEALRKGVDALTVAPSFASFPALSAIYRAVPTLTSAVGSASIVAADLAADFERLHLESRAQRLHVVMDAVRTWSDAQPEDERTVQHLLTWYSERRVTDPEVQPEEVDQVILTTIHGAKGLEWPCVWVLGLEEGYLPRRDAEGEDLEESRRLFYVACTRARDRLRLCWSGHKEPSRFLAEVGE